MKEYAFTKWLVPTLQADGTERDMVYNEQMGIFTVRGENQFQKGSIDTQHTVSLLVLTYIIHSGFISGYQNRYGDNLKPPTNVYHRMTA